MTPFDRAKLERLERVVSGLSVTLDQMYDQAMRVRQNLNVFPMNFNYLSSSNPSAKIWVAAWQDYQSYQLDGDGLIGSLLGGFNQNNFRAVNIDASGNFYVTSSNGFTTLVTSALASSVIEMGNSYSGILFDSSGARYECIGTTIYKIASGVRSTFTTGMPSSRGWAIDGSNNIYSYSASGSTITKITPSGTISTWATFSGPSSGNAMAFNGTSSLYILGNTGSTYYIYQAGVSSFTLIYSGTTAYTSIICDSGGNVFALANTTITKFSGGGSSTFATISARGYTLTIDASNNLYVPVNTDIIKITAAGTVSTYFTLGVGKLGGIAFDNTASAYLADKDNNKTIKLTYSGNSVFLSSFWSDTMIVDASHNVYAGKTFTSGGRSAGLYKITSGGSITSVDTAPITGSMAFDLSGNILACSTDGHVYKYTPSGTRTTFITLGNLGSVAVDSVGNVYVGDSVTPEISVYNAGGTFTDRFTTNAVISNMFIASDGFLYYTDGLNTGILGNEIRYINLSGTDGTVSSYDFLYATAGGQISAMCLGGPLA